jgi:hypothetical protein
LAASIDPERQITDQGDEVASIQRADELVRRAHERLVELVVAARAAGVSWQAIGDALGTSRQAAFQRFRTHTQEEKAMAEQTTDLMERTRNVFESLNADDYEAVRAHMTYATARTLNKKRVMGVWGDVVDATGRLESMDEFTVRTPDGVDAFDRFINRAFANGAIVQTTLRHEAGEWMGRVAYNGSGKITGLLIAPLGSNNLPF